MGLPDFVSYMNYLTIFLYLLMVVKLLWGGRDGRTGECHNSTIDHFIFCNASNLFQPISSVSQFSSHLRSSFLSRLLALG
jgi:hypothetical protein